MLVLWWLKKEEEEGGKGGRGGAGSEAKYPLNRDETKHTLSPVQAILTRSGIHCGQTEDLAASHLGRPTNQE